MRLFVVIVIIIIIIVIIIIIIITAAVAGRRAHSRPEQGGPNAASLFLFRLQLYNILSRTDSEIIARHIACKFVDRSLLGLGYVDASVAWLFRHQPRSRGRALESGQKITHQILER